MGDSGYSIKEIIFYFLCATTFAINPMFVVRFLEVIRAALTI